MTTDAEYRALAESMNLKDAELPDLAERLAERGDCDSCAAGVAILALLEERDEIFAVKMWRAANEDLDRMKARLGKAVEALRGISMACDDHGEDMQFGNIDTVNRIKAYTRQTLSDLEKSE